MAFVEEQDQEEEVGMEQPSQTSAIQTATTGAQPTKPTGPTESGMFTNIQKYIEANKPGAQQMAGKAVGGMEQKAKKVEEEAGQKFGQFQQAAQPELQRLQSTEERVGQYLQEAGTQTPEEAARRREEIAGLSTGAGAYKTIEAPEFAKERIESERLAKQAQKLTGAEGVRNLLEQTYGARTKGMSDLDMMLLQGSKPAREKMIKAAQPIAGRLGTSIAQQEQQVGQSREALQNLARRYAVGGESDVMAQIAGQETGLKGTLEERQARLQQEAQDRYDAARGTKVEDYNAMIEKAVQDIKSGSGAIGQNMTEANLEEYRNLIRQLRPQDIPEFSEVISTGAAATPEETARAQALAALAGRPTGTAFTTAEQYAPKEYEFDPTPTLDYSDGGKLRAALRRYADYGEAF